MRRWWEDKDADRNKRQFVTDEELAEMPVSLRYLFDADPVWRRHCNLGVCALVNTAHPKNAELAMKMLVFDARPLSEARASLS